MPFAKNGDVRIYYESHGDGPALVFVHGSGGHHAAWWQQTPHFSALHRVITLDLRGFGLSDYGDGDFVSGFPGDVNAVLDDAGIDSAVFVCQSLGGSAGLHILATQPKRVTGVIVSSSHGGIVNDEITERVLRDRTVAEKLPIAERLMSRDFLDNEPERRFLFHQMGSFNAANVTDMPDWIVGGPELEALKLDAHKIHFLVGENDIALSPETVRRAHELLPGSTLKVVPGETHSMYWESPAVFNAAVDEILDYIYS